MNDLSDIYLPGSPHPANIGEFLSPLIANIYIVIGVLSLFIIIFAGFNFITAAGDKNKVQQAATMLNFAIVGLVLAAAAFLITRLIGTMTGFEFFNPIV